MTVSSRAQSSAPLGADLKFSFQLDRLRRLFVSRPMLGALQIEHRIYRKLAHSGVLMMRISLGIIFLWFGALKLLPTLTPVDELAERTIATITFHQFQPEDCLHTLAVFECAIGIGLLWGRFLRLTLALLFLQMSGTFFPLILLRHETWVRFPLVPTFEGQYIIKNIVLISAGAIVAATLRGGRIIADPKVATEAEQAELSMEERNLRAAEKEVLTEEKRSPC